MRPGNGKRNIRLHGIFDKIKNEHYLPAFEEGMKQQAAEIAAICNNPEAPTFANTIEALEYSGELLNDVQTVFSNYSGTLSNKELQAVSKEAMPLLSKHGDEISFNEKLFERVKAVYNQKAKERLLSIGVPEEKIKINTTYYF
jgi:peptidyl-dipeptidase Dcp